MSRVDVASIEARSRAAPPARPGRGVIVAIVVVALLLLLATRAVPHPVGAARTFGKYNGKAVSTAESARSSVATAALMATTYAEGNSFTPYAALVTDDAESDVSGLQGTFDSIQPPDARADRLEAQLDAILSDSLTHVRDVRVTLRRSQTPTLEQIRALDDDSRRLGAFIDEHS
jgi:hypothetical protein